MNGREWGWHSRPPMILPSQRGTATARAHKTHSKRRKWHAALWGVDPSVTEWAFVCMCIRVYRQLQASAAAEPAVSWCRMSDQKTPGHTQAWLYMPAPLPRPFSTLFFLGCFSFAVVDPICVTRRFFLLAPLCNPDLTSYQVFFFFSCLPATTSHVICTTDFLMQTKVSVHLTPDKSAPIGGDGGGRGDAGKGQIAQAVGSCVVRKKSSVVPGWKF